MFTRPSGSASTTISGTAFPGYTLTSTGADQWYVDDVAVSGETGSSYVIRLNDIGYEIRQSNSNALTCWSPADFSAVAGFWTPLRNVYTSVSPLTLATNGQNVVRWTDIKNGIQANAGASVPTYDTSGTYPYLLFNSSDSLEFSDLTVYSNKAYGEMLFSGRMTANGSSSVLSCPLCFKTNSASFTRLAIVGRKNGANGLWARTNPLDNSTMRDVGGSGSYLNTDYVIGARAEWFTGGNLTLSVDNGTGSSTTTNATANTPNTSSADATIGIAKGFSNGQVNGWYRCICLVNGALTATERSQLCRYMGLFIGKNIPLV